jgi:cholera toxin transcriptional activator
LNVRCKPGSLESFRPNTEDLTPKPLLLHYCLVAQNSTRVARFGVFELDLSAGELRKNGVKLRLQEQPFQVLALLLERSGEVVTREELQQKLWPSDTFVDFDHSLNTAINKVREALGDSASSPRYVETLARRGYRFIAPVQSPPEARAPDEPSPEIIHTTATSSASRHTPPGSSSDSVTSLALHPELEVPIPRRAITRGLFALIQVMYLAFYLSALFLLRYVQEIGDSLRRPWGATLLAAAVLITAGVGIPLRLYLLSAVSFDYQRLGEKFRQMFPFILALDQLWAAAPFLLIEQIGLGAAFAVSAALLYLPFSERTLIRMAYVGPFAGSRAR